jgi:hypothetical protein
VSRDEARKLLGGYATGSLTEAEQAALFQAAIEDQELFDELADEQALKEILDEPGYRQRLIAALEPSEHRSAWWPWATAAAALAVGIIIVISNRIPPAQPPPQQIAQVMKPPAPPVSAPVAPAPPPSVPVPRKVLPAPPPAPEPPVELKKEAVADQGQEAKPQAATGAVRAFAKGGGGGGARAALRAENSSVRSLTAFALNYAVGVDGFLQIVPTVPGFLSVSANDVVIYPSAPVPPGLPVRIQIPLAATSLVIGFSATPGITGTPVQLDQPAGTVTDQDAPNGRIIVRIPVTR